MNIIAEIQMNIYMCHRWSNRNVWWRAKCLDSVIDGYHQKSFLLTSQSQWQRKLLVIYEGVLLHTSSVTAFWCNLFPQREPSSHVPCNFSNTPTYRYTTNSTAHPCCVFSYVTSQIPRGRHQSMPSRHALLSMATIM